jgi:signal transduction protein with GAF and PtsI domain
MEIYFTEHALQRMAKRAIEPEWVERVIMDPALRLEDDNDPELEHRLAKVPELANRVLRVIVSKSEPKRVVTLYPDRNMKGKL